MGTTESPENVERVCSVCLSDNLLRRIGIRKCARCCEPFCVHYASVFDAMAYCQYCFNDLSLTREIVTKQQEVIDIKTDRILDVITRKAVRSNLGGLDWLFEQRRIPDMTDEELATSIEYHKRDLNLLLTEQDRRRTEKAHKMAAKKIIIGAPSQRVSVTTTETTTVKPVKKGTSSNGYAKKIADLKSLWKLQTGQDLSDEDVLKLLGERKG